MKSKLLLLSIVAAWPVACAFGQDAEPPRPPGPPRDGERRAGPRDGERPRPQGARDGERPRGDGPRDGQRPPGPMPFIAVLDADKDGILSADEIKAAPDAFKKLDRNNDGQISREEWQPPRPPMGDGPRERSAGARDGEQRKAGPRDGDRPRGGPRDGEVKSPERTGDGSSGKKDTAPGGDAKAGRGQAQDRGERPPAPPVLEAIDTDRDGNISTEEISASSESLAKLDTNGDGQLGPREYGPRLPQNPSRREGVRDGAPPEGKPQP